MCCVPCATLPWHGRIVLENSGVAEPQQIRDKFNEAAAEGHPLMGRIELDSLVTVSCWLAAPSPQHGRHT